MARQTSAWLPKSAIVTGLRSFFSRDAGAIVELQCESAPVAANQEFVQLACLLTYRDNLYKQRWKISRFIQRPGQRFTTLDLLAENIDSKSVIEDNIYTYRDGEDIRRGAPPELGSQPQDRLDSLLVHDSLVSSDK